ncbi:hypothetical protein JAAARDRAFT_366528 [Jaapia argillacea MUCL 33604]|uniref:Uncharacterized protein n=1 Tax=Jaapia argillacea MUCL 33604 TaxID=933084 RepID=A0A067Q7Z6_9AGAM|nr:hypothetical protein JAAARDRAFT_366528 [Jaapia argillacea MUCL 33604]
MSSYSSYVPSSPSSPTFGFFPTGPSAPHAFSGFQQSPRDSHSMYASLGSALTSSFSHNTAQGSQGRASGGKFAKFLSRKH